MALNIKNERTVALARELAQLQGTTITSAIEHALEEQLAKVRSGDSPLGREAAERLRRGREIADEISASLTEEDREALRRAQEDMYDENGLSVW